jgi:hypothetical protein
MVTRQRWVITTGPLWSRECSCAAGVLVTLCCQQINRSSPDAAGTSTCSVPAQDRGTTPFGSLAIRPLRERTHGFASHPRGWFAFVVDHDQIRSEIPVFPVSWRTSDGMAAAMRCGHGEWTWGGHARHAHPPNRRSCSCRCQIERAFFSEISRIERRSPNGVVNVSVVCGIPPKSLNIALASL